MSNQILTNKKIAAASAAVEPYAPLLTMGNRKLESEFAESDSKGETVFMGIGGYGKTYQATDMTGKESDIIKLQVPLTINQYRKKFSLGKLNSMYDVGDKPNEIIKPFASEFAYTLNQVMVNELMLGANQSVVATSPSFGLLGSAVAGVEETLMAGTVNGMLGISLTAQITNSGTTQFLSSDLQKKLWQNMIGNYNGVEFAKMPAPSVVTSGIFPAGSVTITTSVDSLGMGTTTATFTATSAPGASISIKKGTLFTVATVNAVGEMGRDTGVARTFVVKADVTIPTNANTVPVAINVGTVYFSGPKKNVSVSAISGLAVTNKLEANSTYFVGAVWNSNELLIAAKGLAAFSGLESNSISGADGFPIRMTVQSDANLSIEDSYMDCLFGSGIYTGRSVCAIYVKQ